MIPELIRREIHIAAPRDRVWTVLTEADHLAAWFTFDGAEIDLRPGGALVLRWKEHGAFHGVVEAVEQPHRLAFRWALLPDVPAGEGNATLVEFTLVPDREGTRVQVVERGFRELAGSDEERSRHVRDNEQGWEGGFAGLRDYVESRTA
ncbi:uncharacterized protein YndB with AHSA1/START domain [Actinoalloteichus hoggarensis]|uniref:Activator of Hsp90 ATPase homologue 1/2-like C-terminal domain-containing protein n=1 Tax=Actinoalloteichus hoggarensis TaxID=1470176 RepID=A0A221W1F6_9PSEU|nr:SRPBCC domain-containing protein [Actinoalloteichus hoggarensis]ASO19606.1 hypothetical protein AHOG_09810 [Actinoalloteichus hoggarensis]MBB5919687.1 uncharacterized protein YndB with AHSA1/START domain [Actinoalloteichus hoggarensis]